LEKKKSYALTGTFFFLSSYPYSCFLFIQYYTVLPVYKHIRYVSSDSRTNVVCFRRVLPSRVKVLGYLRVQQTTALSQHPSVEAQLASHTPRKINDL